MNTIVNSAVDSVVQSLGLAATEGHVGNRTLVRRLASLLKLLECGRSLGLSLLRNIDNTCNDVTHGAAAVAAKDLDGDDVGGFGNAVLAGSDGSSAVRAVAVRILVDIVLRDSEAPASAALEFGVCNVDTRVDDVDIDALTTMRVVLVLGEGTKCQSGAVTYPCKTLKQSD